MKIFSWHWKVPKFYSYKQNLWYKKESAFKIKHLQFIVDLMKLHCQLNIVQWQLNQQFWKIPFGIKIIDSSLTYPYPPDSSWKVGGSHRDTSMIFKITFFKKIGELQKSKSDLSCFFFHLRQTYIQFQNVWISLLVMEKWDMHSGWIQAFGLSVRQN